MTTENLNLFDSNFSTVVLNTVKGDNGKEKVERLYTEAGLWNIVGLKVMTDKAHIKQSDVIMTYKLIISKINESMGSEDEVVVIKKHVPVVAQFKGNLSDSSYCRAYRVWKLRNMKTVNGIIVPMTEEERTRKQKKADKKKADELLKAALSDDSTEGQFAKWAELTNILFTKGQAAAMKVHFSKLENKQ